MILGVFVAPTHDFPNTICKECTLERNWGSRLRDPDFSFPSVFSLFLFSSVTHQKNGSRGNCSEIKLKSKHREKRDDFTLRSPSSLVMLHASCSQNFPWWHCLSISREENHRGQGGLHAVVRHDCMSFLMPAQDFYVEPPGTTCPENKWSHNWFKKAERVNLWNIRLVATSVLKFSTLSLLSTVKSCYLLPPTYHQADGRHSA